MVVNCDIQFENNPQGCFFAGQVLTGKIVLSADKVKQVKGKPATECKNPRDSYLPTAQKKKIIAT